MAQKQNKKAQKQKENPAKWGGLVDEKTFLFYCISLFVYF